MSVRPDAEIDLGPIERGDLRRRVEELERRVAAALEEAEDLARRTGYASVWAIVRILRGDTPTKGGEDGEVDGA